MTKKYEGVKVGEVKQAEKEVGAKALAVNNAQGTRIRVFTAELHGVGFDKLAEGFAKKIGGSVKRIG